MKKSTRFLASSIAVCMAFSAFTGCNRSQGAASAAASGGGSASGQYKMAFILKSLGSNYWTQLKAGAVDEAKKLNVNLTVLAPNSDTATEDQIRMIEDQVVGKTSAVLVAPSNSKAEQAAFDKLAAAKIPLALVDTDAKQYNSKIFFVGSSNSDCGKLAGEYIATKVAKTDTVAILRGALGDETADDRTNGCEAALKAAGITSIAVQPANNDRNTAMTVMQNLLQANPNIKAVYGTNDEMALGAVKALNKSQIGKITVVGTNADVDSLKSILSGGGVTASIRQDPYNMGATAVENAYNYLKGEKVESKITIPVRVIDSKDAQTTLDAVEKVLSANK